MSAPNWLGLLKWTLSTTDGTAPTEARVMSDDDKAFLERVMKECVKDEPQIMNDIIQRFKSIISENTISDSNDEIETKIDELDEIVDQIDMAQVFVKFSGVPTLMTLLESDSLEVSTRSRIATVLGTLSQNNIVVQDQYFKDNVVDRLHKIFLSTSSAKLKTKILYAISCSIRNHAAAETQFILNYASDILTPLENDLPLLRKILYLGNALVTSEHIVTSIHVQQILCKFFIPNCINYLHNDDIELRELTYTILTSISKCNFGWNLIHTTCLNELTSILQIRETSARNEHSTNATTDSTDEESSQTTEINYIHTLKEVLYQTTAPEVPSTANNVLMICP